MRPAKSGSTTCPGEVGAVEGLALDLERRLRPLLVLLELRSLRALLMLKVSDVKTAEGACGEDPCVVCVPGIGGCLGSEEYRTGGTSQCVRKCSPRTELYGLHTLPCCMYECYTTHE